MNQIPPLAIGSRERLVQTAAACVHAHWLLLLLLLLLLLRFLLLLLLLRGLIGQLHSVAQLHILN